MVELSFFSEALEVSPRKLASIVGDDEMGVPD